MYSVHFKELYIIKVLFSTKFRLFRNFIFWYSDNIHAFHKAYDKVSILTPSDSGYLFDTNKLYFRVLHKSENCHYINKLTSFKTAKQNPSTTFDKI